jgi:tryptophan synthase alpha chain
MTLAEIFRGPGAAFMPYLCCGDPSAEFTCEAAGALARGGADGIELGIPFSDPIADGKMIQAASVRALAGGMTAAKALETVRRIRGSAGIPVIVMTYYNVILANGGASFLGKAARAGAQAVIVPDVPLEESAALGSACSEGGLGLIRMISISSDEGRIRSIAGKAEGFIYAVGALGTTGAREAVDEEAVSLVRRIKGLTGLPVAAGFGISRAEHARAFARAGADGVIVGSAIAGIYSKHIRGDGSIDAAPALEELAEYAAEMKEACRAV